jgi:predicted subunit of tRNA(5-methylaminomethyl-2-thiouridylate) methyltransferase
MKAGVLFSGGKDSSLAALMLSRDYEVELNTFVFSPGRTIASVGAAADALRLPLKKRIFEKGLLEQAVNIVIECGYPNNAINLVHREAAFSLAQEYGVIADGTRFDDRVPMLTRADVQRIGSLYGCRVVRPLLGYVRAEVDRLIGNHLRIAYGETGTIGNGDYEAELRAACRERGADPSTLFPSHHEQSVVIGRIESQELVS